MEDRGRPPASCKEARQGTSGRGKNARARSSGLIPHGACNIKPLSQNRTNSSKECERRTGIHWARWATKCLCTGRHVLGVYVALVFFHLCNGPGQLYTDASVWPGPNLAERGLVISSLGLS